MSFSSFAAAVFSPRDVYITPRAPVHYSKLLGQSGNINSTGAFIQALLLSSAHGIYGVRLCYTGSFFFLSLTLIYVGIIERSWSAASHQSVMDHCTN